MIRKAPPVPSGYSRPILAALLAGNRGIVGSELSGSIVVPLLRGGGYAVTLENLTSAERSLLYTLREFAQYRNDYEVVVPLELLRRAERTKQIFNLVLGSIAAISLLVGGIGIMNIMLANVTERTREIGIRRALGARRKHIITQFLVESVLLSGAGGLIGVALGIAIPFAVSALAHMKVIVTPWSPIAAFTLSGLVGILFGIYPARRAAALDPVEALRHE